MKKLSTILCVGWLLVFVPSSFSNNISVSNVSLEGQVVIDHYCLVEFDLSWDNSWRTTSVPQNWDAVWVFVKYSVAGGPWHHAKIDPAGSVQPAGCILDFADTTGVFIYRDADGSGTFSITDIGLRWSYGDNGVADDATIEVKVFAIEMVYVPQGNFYLGDGISNHTCFEYPSTTQPFEVDNSPIIIGNAEGNLFSGLVGSLITGPFPSDYPIGYEGFYSMKYEMSQEQYVDFLNSLSRLQQDLRTNSDVSDDVVLGYFVMGNSSTVFSRDGVRCDASGLGTTNPINFYCDLNNNGVANETDDGQNIPANHLTWMDMAAYADWAGLRPMTEGEFEKACRGPNTPVAGEYAWGNTNIHLSIYTPTNAGAANEGISDMGVNTGNALNNQTDNTFLGPVRCGIFAANSANHTRMETGATYYGIMEMSGNLTEMVVAIFNKAGRSYTGVHGDGFLTLDGDANSDYWPGIEGNTNYDNPNTVYSTIGVNAAAGIIQRGSYFQRTYTDLTISNRTNALLYTNLDIHHAANGGRLVRTAPTP